MSFDLSSLDAGVSRQEEGIPVDIRHPATGKPLGITITVASYESERVKAVAREMGNQLLLQQRRNPKKADSVEAHEERTFRIALAAIIGWEGVEMAGKPLPFSRENARTVLERYPFIAEQIDAAAGDRAAFFAT